MLVNALLTGILFIVFVYIGAFFAKYIAFRPSLPEECAKWNKGYIMEINLLISGMIFYMVLNAYGIMQPLVNV